MKYYVFRVMLSILLFIPVCGYAGTASTITYAVFPAPPYMIEADGSATHQISGIDVDIVREIARRMSLKITFIKGNWSRCLNLMENGNADLLSSAFKKPDREVFMAYFKAPYLEQLPIAFYSKKRKGFKIETYDDLYAIKSIGVLRGASYFDRFDSDTKIHKYKISRQEQLLPMLLSDHLDMIAEYVPTFNYWISTQGYAGQITKSAYQYSQPSQVYMALSRKSPFASRIDEFNAVNDTLLKNGFIARKIKEYTEKYR